PYPESDTPFDYGCRGAVSDHTDVDFYRVQSPQAAPGRATVLTATIWSQGDSTLIPRVQVFDAQQNRVAAEVLVNDGGSYVVQLPSATPNATYYVEVLAANPHGNNAVGAYYLGIDFGTQAVVLQSDIDTTLNDTNR